MRIQPIEKPTGLMMRLAYWYSNKLFGKVMTPMKVAYPRLPGLVKVQMAIGKLQAKGLSLEPSLHFLLSVHTSQINGCGFCMDIARAMAVKEHIGMDKFNALPQYRTNPLFTPKERAALAYVEESTRHKHVSDETFAELKRHFDDRQIVEITWSNAVENYYNIMNIALGLESDGLCAIAESRAA